MTGYYLGIDGGGTKTEAVIIDSSGHIKGVGVGGASNFGNIGKTQATQNIHTAVHSAASAASIAPLSFNAAFLGIAGTVSEDDRKVVFQMALDLGLAPEARIGVDHDCRVALAGGLGGQPGIVQIIGTGTSCFGMNAAGERWMAGGWGHLIADEGGGYWFGIQAMKAATAAFDTRGEKTLLANMVLRALGISRVDQIMQRLYQNEMSVAEIAAVGRFVLDAAGQGDQVAMDIITHGMYEIARCIDAVAKVLRFEEEELKLVCTGGILKAGPVVTTPLAQAVHSLLPTCKIEAPLFSSAVGAALLALQLHSPDTFDKIVINL